MYEHVDGHTHGLSAEGMKLKVKADPKGRQLEVGFLWDPRLPVWYMTHT